MKDTGNVRRVAFCRAQFLSRQEMLDSVDAATESYAILVISSATLSAVNRLHGLSAGDRVVAALRSAIKAALPRSGICAHLTGGRFIIAVPFKEQEPQTDELECLAQCLLSEISQSAVEIPGNPRSGTIRINADLRIGACCALRRTPNDAEILLDGAIAAHDEAKRHQARVRVCVLDGEVDSFAGLGMARRALAAIQANEISIALQPVVSADNPARVMFREALIRITGPDGTLISAGQFMPDLERLGMTEAADIAVLRAAFDQLSSDPGLRLSVNLSRAAIARPAWLVGFTELAARLPHAAERLIVEVTEEVALADCEAAASLFMAIRAHGSALALDDFGAGRTSFRHLRDFRFDIVKIDGTFIAGIDKSPDNQMLVSVLSTIARQFDMLVIAEYVETPAEARTLANLGVDGYQGFLYGRPALVWDNGRDLTKEETSAL